MTAMEATRRIGRVMAGLGLLLCAAAPGFSTPPGIQLRTSHDAAVVEVRLDPGSLRVHRDTVTLPGWTPGPGTHRPPLPRADVLVPAESGRTWVIDRIESKGETVVSVGNLEPQVLPVALQTPPGVPEEAWKESLRRDLASRWRAAARVPAARMLDPVQRDGRWYARLRLEPVRWNPDTGTVTVPERIVVTLRPAAAERWPRGLTAPVAPYEGADPAFQPKALTIHDRAGILHMEWSELGSLLGWNTGSLDPSRIQVWEGGAQVAVDISEGQWLELFVRPRTGEAVSGEFRKGDWTDQRVYWFIVGDGSVPSLRVASADATPGSATLLAEYPESLRLRDEADCRYFSAHVPETDDEVFHWRTASWSGFYAPPELEAALPLDLPGLAAGSPTPLTVSVRLLGAASLSSLSPQHRQVFRLRDGSGQVLTEVTDPTFDFDGNTVHVDTFELAPSNVAAGDGFLYAVAADPSDRCVGTCPTLYWDITYVDWVDVTYPRAPVAVDGVCPVAPGVSGPFRVRVSGLDAASAGGLRAWDVTDPAAPIRFDGWSWSGGVLELEASASAESRYLVTDASGWIRPLASDFRAATEHDWASGPAGGADWVAIGPRALVESQPMAELEAARRSGGLRTAVVPVEEVYDEFSGGVPTPWAIRSFVVWALDHWAAPAPSMILLVGDATIDTKNQARPCQANCNDNDPDNDVFGPVDFPDPAMPTWVEVVPGDGSGFGVLASDSWFADPGSGPAATVGRLPARDAGELERMVDRLLAVEAAVPEAEAWTTRFELVAGARDASALEPVMDDLAGTIPGAFLTSKLYFAEAPWNGTTADADGNGVSDMVDRMNGGRVVVDWLGHSGFTETEAVPGASGLAVTDLEEPGADLVTDTALFAAGACYLGAFDHYAVQPVLGEALLAAPAGGAAAVIAHAASSYVWAADEMFGGIQDTLTGLERSTRVGDAHAEAVWRTMEAGHDQEAASLVLLGDPAMRVPVPDPPAPGAPEVAEQSCARLWLSWTMGDAVSATLYRSVEGGEWESVLEGIPAVPVEAPPAAPGTTVAYRATLTDAAGFTSGWGPVLTVTAPAVTSVVGDLDCSCSLEAADLAEWIVGWYGGEDPCQRADVNDDGAVTTRDLGALVELFF